MNQTQKGFATLGTLIAAALFVAAACIDSTTSIAGKAAEIGVIVVLVAAALCLVARGEG